MKRLRKGNRTSSGQDGFTLVELLIALALLSLILTAVVSLNIGTSRAAALLQARNDLLPESQIAQNYMASKLRQATYVFPNGSAFTLNGTSTTTRDPSGSALWTVGSDPVVAFIVPPRMVSTGQCLAATAAANTANQDTYCYAFYSFYGTMRNNITSSAGLENPGADAANDSTSWVLMEYRSYYAAGNAGGYTTPAVAVAAIPTGGVGHLLMDYLKPTTETGTDVLFNCPAATGNVMQVAGTTNVTMNLAAYRSVAGQPLNLPSTGRYALTVYPRNLGATQTSN